MTLSLPVWPLMTDYRHDAPESINNPAHFRRPTAGGDTSPRCGSRHQRESRGDRTLELALVAPFAIAILAGWCAVGFLFLRMIRDSVWSLGWVLVLLSLAALCALATRYLIPEIKRIFAMRGVSCLEK